MKQIPLLPGKVYHIYTHANGFENIFNCEENYLFYMKKYLHYIYPIAHTYAYCLMPNHIHFMIRIRSEKELLEFVRIKTSNKLKRVVIEHESINENENVKLFSTITSQQFSHLFNGYTQAFNKMYNRKGSLFIPNFKRKEANNEIYMAHLIAYIHKNPIHHSFTSELKDWPYSSFHAYSSEKRSLINKKYMIDGFGNKQEFIQFHKSSRPPLKWLFED